MHLKKIVKNLAVRDCCDVVTKVVDIQICVYQIRKGVLCNLKDTESTQIFLIFYAKIFIVTSPRKKGSVWWAFLGKL